MPISTSYQDTCCADGLISAVRSAWISVRNLPWRRHLWAGLTTFTPNSSHGALCSDANQPKGALTLRSTDGMKKSANSNTALILFDLFLIDSNGFFGRHFILSVAIKVFTYRFLNVMKSLGTEWIHFTFMFSISQPYFLANIIIQQFFASLSKDPFHLWIWVSHSPLPLSALLLGCFF